MSKEDLEIGKIYTCGGEPIYKLVCVGIDWVMVLHYSTVHYICNPEFFKLEDFLNDFEKEDDDWSEYIFDDELIYGDWMTLINKHKE